VAICAGIGPNTLIAESVPTRVETLWIPKYSGAKAAYEILGQIIFLEGKITAEEG
jgi:hypothetical protein